jgi:glucokinase
MIQLAIDLGGTTVKIGLVENGTLLIWRHLEARSAQGLGQRLTDIEEATTAMLADAGISTRRLQGCGVAFPGIVDPVSGTVVATNEKFSDATRMDLHSWVESQWRVPLSLENDARLACVGEWAYGAARSFNDVVTITLGTGIGSGVIIGGRLLRGKHSQAGCLGGHFVIDISTGAKCSCGNIGCAEANASTWALQRDIRHMRQAQRQSILTGGTDATIENIGFKEILASACSGNDSAESFIDRAVRVWGALAVTLLHAYDPEIIVLDGAIAKSTDRIVPAIRHYVDTYAWMPQYPVKVVRGDFPDTAALLGAAWIVTQEDGYACI